VGRGWGWGRVCFARRRENNFTNGTRCLQYVIVPEAKHAIALRLKPCRPAFIVVTAHFSMLAPVDLDDKLALMPNEISDENADRGLPPEVNSKRLHRTQHVPESLLGIGWPMPQRPCLLSGPQFDRAVRHFVS
jgi:hypothetical protein